LLTLIFELAQEQSLSKPLVQVKRKRGRELLNKPTKRAKPNYSTKQNEQGNCPMATRLREAAQAEIRKQDVLRAKKKHCVSQVSVLALLVPRKIFGAGHLLDEKAHSRDREKLAKEL